MGAVFVATYLAVLGAEIGGDKLLYTIGVLAGRFNRLSIASGMAAAFMFKMGVAVILGSAIANLPKPAVLAGTGAGFLWVAWNVWRHPKVKAEKSDAPSSAATLLSFSAVVFSEWGDLGQITAAAMSARFNAPLVVWVGAVLAMMSKGVLAVIVGTQLPRWTRGRVSDTALRFVSVALLLTLGTLSMIETFGR